MRAYVTNRVVRCADEGNGAVMTADVVFSGSPLEASTLGSISVSIADYDSLETIQTAVVAAVDAAAASASLNTPDSIVSPASESLR